MVSVNLNDFSRHHEKKNLLMAVSRVIGNGPLKSTPAVKSLLDFLLLMTCQLNHLLSLMLIAKVLSI